MFNCNSDEKQSGGRDKRVWTGSPAWRAAPSPALSLPSLQGSEQLGEYNHGGNATGQADKRGLGAGPGRRWGLSVCLFIWLSVKITVLRANGGLGQPVYPWSREKGRLWLFCTTVLSLESQGLILLPFCWLHLFLALFAVFCGGVKENGGLLS